MNKNLKPYVRITQLEKVLKRIADTTFDPWARNEALKVLKQ